MCCRTCAGWNVKVLPGGKPATMVRIFDPAIAEKEGAVIDSYESLDAQRRLILYDGYYRGSEMADIHIGRMEPKEY